MGMIKRLKDIMEANVNGLLSKMENPELMCNQAVRNAEKSLYQAKNDTATVIVEEKNCKRNLEQCKKEIAELAGLAKKAVQKGEDEHAMEFIQQKQELEEKLVDYETAYQAACDNTVMMKKTLKEMEASYESFKIRQGALNSKAKVAKTKNRLRGLSESNVKAMTSNIAYMERAEVKINRMLDEYEALEEMEASEIKCGNLKKMYENEEKAEKVRKEFEQLKEAVGQ